MKFISQFKFITNAQVRIFVLIFQSAKENVSIINYF